MPNPFTPLVRQLRRLAGGAEGSETDDATLLSRFIRERDEVAFADLVRRHGSMVLGAAQRVLGDADGAADVFQATFLLLARKAGGLRGPGLLSAWLYGVTVRLSLKARTSAARRRRHEQAEAGARTMHTDDPAEIVARSEARRLMDEELQRLPEKYRVPLVLCYLEGLTNEEAAARLRWPVGSVKTRLSRGRDLLSAQLTRRGLAVAGPLVATVLAEATAGAAVSTTLLDITVRAAAGFAAGQAVPMTGASAGAVELTQGALRAMTFHKFKLVAGMAAVLALLAGTGAAFFPKAAPPIVPVAQAADEAPPVFTLPAETPQVKTDRDAVVKGNTEFAFDLYKQLAQDEKNQGKNLFLSPYSISTALAMTYAGARGKTAEEMATTLHFPVEPDRLHPAFAGLVGRFQANKEDRGYQLSVANALWGQKNYRWEKDFMRTTFSNYAAGLRPVDFGSGREETRQTINAWVEEQTKDKIKELIKAGILTQDTRMVLTNAIYFKGDWKEQFNKEATHAGPFRGTSDPKATAEYMHRNAQYSYFENDGCQALELPYKGDQLSMVVLLPKKLDGLADLEKQLTAANLAGWLAKLTQQKVWVAVPKFRVTSDFSLGDTLQALGMTTAFGGEADFSGMTTDEKLLIAKVIHKAFVDVNEEGTEAAAATAVIMEAKTGRRETTFQADHPFLFLVRDKQSGSVLFLGRLTEPGK